MQRISPFLWFDTQAEEAATYYASVFRNSKIHKITRYGDAGPGPKGSVMTVEFELDGQPFIALNGGPHFKFTEAVSFSVDCGDQREVDEYWAKLSAGGEEWPCGWLKDKYGLSWQIKLGDGRRAQVTAARLFRRRRNPQPLGEPLADGGEVGGDETLQ